MKRGEERRILNWLFNNISSVRLLNSNEIFRISRFPPKVIFYRNNLTGCIKEQSGRLSQLIKRERILKYKPNGRMSKDLKMPKSHEQ